MFALLSVLLELPKVGDATAIGLRFKLEGSRTLLSWLRSHGYSRK